MLALFTIFKTMSYTFQQNKEANRFEVHTHNQTAFVDYEIDQNQIELIHTEVPKELGGKGIGSYLAENSLKFAKNNQLKVKPSCSFIKNYIDKHPEYQSISKLH